MLGRSSNDFFSISKNIENLSSLYKDPSYEIELRIGKYKDKKFIPGVSLLQFNRLLRILTKEVVFRKTEETTTDEYNKEGIRKTINDNKILYIEKKPITSSYKDIYDYGIRLAINIETKKSPIESFVSISRRDKLRHSFYLQNILRIDLTYVNTIRENKIISQQYEVEIELLEKNERSGEITINILGAVLRALYDTEYLYNFNELTPFLEINKLLGSKYLIENRDRIDSTTIVTVRNLKLRDMTWGGLLGNPNETYRATHKTDGIRRYLCIIDSIIWLMWSNGDSNLVGILNTSALDNTILDGEIVPMESRRGNAPTSKYWFIVFDCLYYSSQDVRQLNHFQRMGYAQTSVDKLMQYQIDRLKQKDIDDIKKMGLNKFEYEKRIRELNAIIYSPILSLNTKTFYSFRDTDATMNPDRALPISYYGEANDQGLINGQDSNVKFYAVMQKMVDEEPLLPYKTDGIIFTPHIHPYNTLTQTIPLYKRDLNNYVDICKWKPVEELTIDFKIRWRALSQGTRTLDLYSYEGKNRDTLFKGNIKYPYTFTVDLSDTRNSNLLNLSSEQIIEFAWDKNTFYYVRIREDKTKPNRIDIANDVWDDIHNPIDIKTLTGENSVLMRKYHNNMKRYLYNQSTIDLKENKVLLDLGSGRGGDINKWKAFDKVYAVEPDEDNIINMKKRIEASGEQNKIIVIKATAQDTDIIKSALGNIKVDVISMMLSSTFIWKSEVDVHNLLNTIRETLKDGGHFISASLDGQALLQMFNPAFGGAYFIDFDFSFGKIEFIGRQENGYYKIATTINDSILKGRQVEYMPFIKDLSIYMNDLTLINYIRFDTEKFLSTSERLVSSMYSGYHFIYRNIDNKITLPKAIIGKNIKRLETLRVIPQQDKNLPAYGDDAIEKINVNWSNNLYRMAVIGDGSCFFHALLKAMSLDYYNNKSYKYRVDFTKRYRKILSIGLSLPSKLNSEITWYDQYPLKEFQESGLEEYSLNNMKKLFDSSESVGEEVYQYVADAMKLDIYIMLGLENGLYFLTKSISKDPNTLYAVILIGNTVHYELLSRLHNNKTLQIIYVSNIRSYPCAYKNI